jgi:hypothetical protein
MFLKCSEFTRWLNTYEFSMYVSVCKRRSSEVKKTSFLQFVFTKPPNCCHMPFPHLWAVHLGQWRYISTHTGYQTEVSVQLQAPVASNTKEVDWVHWSSGRCEGKNNLFSVTGIDPRFHGCPV